MRTRTLFSALLVMAVLLPACDGGDPDPDPVVQPSFSVASVVVTLADGSQGLQFAATPNEDVQVTRVDIRNPLGNTVAFNGNNNVFLANQAFSLQDANVGYIRVSGNWNFSFVGRRAAGDQASFSVNVPLSVSALRDAPVVASE